MTWTYEISGAKATITGASPLPSALVFPNNLGGFTEMIIKNYLFQTRSVLESVQISDGVAVIGCYAFSKCPNLASVKTENGVKNIGEHAFFECKKLKSLTIGNNVTNIGIWAFGYCTNLVSVEIGDNLRSVEGHGFDSCYKLRYLAFPDSLESIASGTSGALKTGGDLYAVAVPKSWQGTDKLNGTGVRTYTKIYYGTQKVTFNPTGGACEIQTHRVGVGATYKEFGGLPEAMKQGNRFVGWFTDPGKGTQVTEDSTVPDTATRTLYARWKPTQTVTFDPNGGTCLTETKVVDRGQATDTYGWVPVASREYFAFLGWFSEKDGGEKVESNTMVTGGETRTLYAHWEAPATVWRFYSPVYKGHFFTIDEAEKDGLIAGNPNWNFEGAAYRAFPERRPGTVALHRFYSQKYRGHFYTIDEAEKNDLEATNPNWKYEGIAFYALPADDTGKSAKGAGRAAAATGDAAGAAGTGLAAGTGSTGVAGKTGEAGGGGMARLSAFSALSGNADDGVCEVAAPWTLTLRQPCPGRVLAVPDVADLGEVTVETSEDMAAGMVVFAAAMNADDGDENDAELRLTLPDGVFTAQLWDGAGTLLEESEAEGVFDFELDASGAWHWLVVLDADGEEAFSVWLRAVCPNLRLSQM